MLSHRNKWFCAILLLAPHSIFAGSENELPAETFRASTSEVRLAFFTTDQNNRSIENVTKDDFVIVDDGMVVRDFRSFSRSQETTLDVVVMIDASGSVTDRLQFTIDQVLRLASEKELTVGNNISIVRFSGIEPKMVCSRDCASAEVGETLRSLRAAGATPLYDALDYTADYLSQNASPHARRVIILFSDGNDSISKISLDSALQAVIASSALVYTVDLNISGEERGKRNKRNESAGTFILQRMADTTGGRYFSSEESAANALQAALEDLRASYVVTYELPRRSTGFHSLRILPKHNSNLQFHCRAGYYYGASAP